MTRTDQEIISRIHLIARSDFFGFIRGDLIAYLPYAAAREFLKDGVLEAEWSVLPRDSEAILAQILAYMPFAWEKANNCRGLSAGRSIDHMAAWLWMLGEERAAEEIADYDRYGKPQLAAICEHFGWPWQGWDDGDWVHDEGGRLTSKDVAALTWAQGSGGGNG